MRVRSYITLVIKFALLLSFSYFAYAENAMEDTKLVEKDVDYDNGGDQVETSKYQGEKLFYQFRMVQFRVKPLNDSAVHLEWTIGNATNKFDWDRILNISTVHGLGTEFLQETRIRMNNKICQKLSDLEGKCNHTFGVKPCSNYLFRLGGDRNTDATTTVTIDPTSLQEEFSENGSLILRWNITCDNDFMAPVYVTLASSTPSSNQKAEKEKLSAACENRTCVTHTKKLRTSPCKVYKLNIDGSDPREVETPPTSNFLIRKVSSVNSVNGTLVTMTISFDRALQKSCSRWNVSLELEFLDLQQNNITTLAYNLLNEEIYSSENLTVSIVMEQPEILCLLEHHLRIRPVYSRPNLTATVYRGNWTETTVKAAFSLEWDTSESLRDLTVNTEVAKQSIAAFTLEWKSQLCLGESAQYSTDLSIVTDSKEASEYHVTIPYACSQLSKGRGSLSRKVIINNTGHVVCNGGEKLPDQKKLLMLKPCTSYSLNLTPSTSKDGNRLNGSSVMHSFTTNFIPPDTDNPYFDSIKIFTSHIFDDQWRLQLFVDREYSPCDKRIVSAIFNIPFVDELNQTILCNHSLSSCNGVVQFSQIDLCQSNVVSVGLQYSSVGSEKIEHISWFEKTLPPLKNEKNESSPSSLEFEQIDRHRFDFRWRVPTCLNTAVLSGWILKVHMEDKVFDTFTVPQNCSRTEHIDYQRVGIFLESGKVMCDSNVTVHHMNLAPCTNYMLFLTPVVAKTNKQLMEYSQSIRFTKPPNSTDDLGLRIMRKNYMSETRENKKGIEAKEKIYRVNAQEAIQVYWNDPVCWTTTEILAWEVRLNSTEHSRRIRLSSECSSGSHLPASERETSFKHSLHLDKGHLSQCSDSTSIFDSHESDFIFWPCSSYVFSVIPIVGGSSGKEITLEAYARTAHLNVSIEKVNPEVSNVTSNSFELTWSFPVQCLQEIQKEQITVDINGTTSIANLMNLTSNCSKTTCMITWTSPVQLDACTEYTISVDSVVRKILTLPDHLFSDDSSSCSLSRKSGTGLGTSRPVLNSTTEFSNKNLLSAFLLIISLGLLGVFHLLALVGLSICICKKKTDSSNAKIQTDANLWSKNTWPPEELQDTNGLD